MDVNAVDPPRPHEPPPDIGQTASAAENPSALAISAVVLAVLATLYTMYFAREFFVPVVFAVLLNFLLSPVIRVLQRIKIPPPAGAALVVLVLVGGVAGGVYSLAGPAQTLANSAPETIGRANTKLRALFLARFQKATSQVERAAATLGDSTTGRPPRQVVVSTQPTIGSRILGTTQILVAAVVEIVVLLYFLLAGGDLFLQKFIKMLPTLRDKRRAVNVARAIEAAVSAYLSTALFVNLAEGVVVGLCLWALGMPTPALWGAMIVAVEFVPYLGALTGVVVLALGRTGELRQRRPCAAHSWELPRDQSDSGQPRDADAAGSPVDAQSGRDLRGPDVLLLDLGCGRRVSRGAAVGHAQDRVRPYRFARGARRVSR